MALDYFYGQAGELFSFYRIPKALFQEPRFQSLSTDAKILYGILLDRMSLSVKNGWLDEQNRVFIIFTIEDVKRALCCADNKATKLLRELEKFGLIERKRRGLGKPSLVYVKNFSAESSKSIFQNRDFHDSGGFKNASQDPSKSRCNKTKENDTEMSETDPFYSKEADGMSKRTQLEEYFSQSLEVELLLRLCPDDEDAKLKPVHDTFIKKNFKLTKDAYAAQHKEELDTFNKAVRTLMKLNGSTTVNFSALDAEFSALQSGSAELRSQLETLQPDLTALKNVHKYIDLVLNKQQLSAPGGKTPEKESVLKKLHEAKATPKKPEQRKNSPEL